MFFHVRGSSTVLLKGVRRQLLAPMEKHSRSHDKLLTEGFSFFFYFSLSLSLSMKFLRRPEKKFSHRDPVISWAPTTTATMFSSLTNVKASRAPENNRCGKRDTVYIVVMNYYERDAFTKSDTVPVIFLLCASIAHVMTATALDDRAFVAFRHGKEASLPA